MSIIKQICRQKTNGCNFPDEVEDYIFHLLRKKRHLPQGILDDIKLIRHLQDTLSFIFQNNNIVGIFNNDKVDKGIGRTRLLRALDISSDIKVPSGGHTVKIINSLTPGNAKTRVLEASSPERWRHKVVFS